ncbi:FHA domain-containing protein [Aggregicoccus sp. 17bor-14]|uniref:FHA domain-containing protein n=1 Tax=Myxococcaceae TaxID=31 RepID=UPI00129C928D|nr:MULTISPECIES: FHA domain-containing protein [Myxococcaceae]MBF5043621.1 FHA domain-containing protein [Simulacricoccus sp. 17bor-14]MRI89380.1 FHA domain-containing protein [Aggregicoccus sp. 17bor-14]
MGFQLTIAEGQDAGRELHFDQDEVLLGRADTCDVVLHDAGVSRRHCRIAREPGAGHWSVEDLGSANGTLLNGEPVQGRRALTAGDELALGDAAFLFAPQPASAAPSAPAEPPADPDSTRIVAPPPAASRRASPAARVEPSSAAAPARSAVPLASAASPGSASPRSASAPPRAAGAGPSAPGASAAKAHAAGPSAAAGRPAAAGALASPSRGPARPATARAALPERSEDAAPGAALAAVSEEAPAALAVPPPRPAPRARPAPGQRLTAAERARLRRTLPPLLARARLFWAEARPPVRRGLLAGAGALGAGLVALLFWAVLGSSASGERGAEPAVLSARPLADSFGLGEGVTWERPDMKVFTWEYTAATRAVVLLHLQAQGLSQGEVMVTVNGADVGALPADRLNSQERALEVRVPPELLKKGQPNRITFDNTHNPPGEDPWRIWNLWVETALLPEMPSEQLVAAAREAYARGEKNLQAKDIGAGNRYAAWRAFREAWLLLEAHPEPRPALHLEARDRVREAQAELDRTCSRLLLEVEGDANRRDWKAVAAGLDQFKEYFPASDQPCRARAERKRAGYGL